MRSSWRSSDGGTPMSRADGSPDSGRKAAMSVTSIRASAIGASRARAGRRHRLVDRLYHWAMAACVLTLMGTAFLPIIGIKFEWLTIHWTTGLVLTALVLFHIVRATIWQHLSRMMIDLADIGNGWKSFMRLFGAAAPPGKQGKVQRGAEALSRRRGGAGAGARRDRPADAAQDRHAVVAPQSLSARRRHLGRSSTWSTTSPRWRSSPW